jgi:hypothetical protein
MGHVFVTAQGSALIRYRRALERRHIVGAEIAAREMAYLSSATLWDYSPFTRLRIPRSTARRRRVGSADSRAGVRRPLVGKRAVRRGGALQALPRRPDSALKVLVDVSR